MYVYIHINYSATGPGFCPSSLCGKLKNSLLVFENIARYPTENDMFQPEPKNTQRFRNLLRKKPLQTVLNHRLMSYEFVQLFFEIHLIWFNWFLPPWHEIVIKNSPFGLGLGCTKHIGLFQGEVGKICSSHFLVLLGHVCFETSESYYWGISFSLGKYHSPRLGCA